MITKESVGWRGKRVLSSWPGEEKGFSAHSLSARSLFFSGVLSKGSRTSTVVGVNILLKIPHQQEAGLLNNFGKGRFSCHADVARSDPWQGVHVNILPLSLQHHPGSCSWGDNRCWAS